MFAWVLNAPLTMPTKKKKHGGIYDQVTLPEKCVQIRSFFWSVFPRI